MGRQLTTWRGTAGAHVELIPGLSMACTDLRVDDGDCLRRTRCLHVVRSRCNLLLNLLVLDLLSREANLDHGTFLHDLHIDIF